MKILVVEDEKALNNILKKLLVKMEYQVDTAFDGLQALQILQHNEYDVVIMDIMMPKMNGYKCVEQMRIKKINTPVIMLTAKDGLNDKITGLNIGADDYLVKPFEFEELLARINALIRRKYGNSNNILQVDTLSINTENKTVTRDNIEIKLTAKEYQILEYLVRNENKILSREQIRQHVWEYDYDTESNVIDVLIKNIRKKIDVNNSKPLIHTKRGLGYTIRSEN